MLLFLPDCRTAVLDVNSHTCEKVVGHPHHIKRKILPNLYDRFGLKEKNWRRIISTIKKHTRRFVSIGNY